MCLLDSKCVGRVRMLIQLLVYGYVSKLAGPKESNYVAMQQGQGFQPMMKLPEQANMAVMMPPPPHPAVVV